jgi:hypothetical protein
MPAPRPPVATDQGAPVAASPPEPDRLPRADAFVDPVAPREDVGSTQGPAQPWPGALDVTAGPSPLALRACGFEEEEEPVASRWPELPPAARADPEPDLEHLARAVGRRARLDREQRGE